MGSEIKKDKWQLWILQNQDKWLLYARQHTHSDSDAYDVLQDALVSIWEQCKNSDELPHPGTMFTAIRYRAINSIRSDTRRCNREQIYFMDKIEHPEYYDADCSNDEKLLMVKALEHLPKEQSEVVTLHIWGELTFQQIADICRKPLNTIISRYRQALEKLQKELKSVIR